MKAPTAPGLQWPAEPPRPCATPARHQECDALKRFASLQAHAALLGLVLHQLPEADGTTAYLIARNTMSKDLAGLDAVADFLNCWEGKP